MSERMCAYGNCDEMIRPNSPKVSVTESANGKITRRDVYCSQEHAAAALADRVAHEQMLNKRDGRETE